MAIDAPTPKLVRALLASQARASAAREKQHDHRSRARRSRQRSSLERAMLLLKSRPRAGWGIGDVQR